MKGFRFYNVHKMFPDFMAEIVTTVKKLDPDFVSAFMQIYFMQFYSTEV